MRWHSWPNFSAGTTPGIAIFPGAAPRTPIASGYPRSCCSRPARRPSSLITSGFWSVFRTPRRWRARPNKRCWRAGAGWDTIRARATCTKPRGWWRGVSRPSYEAIRQLPGVGEYTAAAIASIAFGLPHAVVDGNVMRVIARVTNDAADIGAARTRARFREIAQEWLDRRRPGRFNQALMELGATVCLPRAPRCGICPLAAGMRSAPRRTHTGITGQAAEDGGSEAGRRAGRRGTAGQDPAVAEGRGFAAAGGLLGIAVG